MSESDRIYIGPRSALRRVEGIVVQQIEPGSFEVVYLDWSSRNNPIGAVVVWSGDHWDFAPGNTTGTYAMNSDRLRPFAERLLSWKQGPTLR